MLEHTDSLHNHFNYMPSQPSTGYRLSSIKKKKSGTQVFCKHLPMHLMLTLLSCIKRCVFQQAGSLFWRGTAGLSAGRGGVRPAVGSITSGQRCLHRTPPLIIGDERSRSSQGRQARTVPSPGQRGLRGTWRGHMASVASCLPFQGTPPPSPKKDLGFQQAGSSSGLLLTPRGGGGGEWPPAPPSRPARPPHLGLPRPCSPPPAPRGADTHPTARGRRGTHRHAPEGTQPGPLSFSSTPPGGPSPPPRPLPRTAHGCTNTPRPGCEGPPRGTQPATRTHTEKERPRTGTHLLVLGVVRSEVGGGELPAQAEVRQAVQQAHPPGRRVADARHARRATSPHPDPPAMERRRRPR